MSEGRRTAGLALAVAVGLVAVARVATALAGRTAPFLAMPRWVLVGIASLVITLGAASALQVTRKGSITPGTSRLSLLAQAALLVMLLGVGVP